MTPRQATIAIVLVGLAVSASRGQPADRPLPGPAVLIVRLPPVERSAVANAPRARTLGELESIALRRNPSLARAALAVDAARANWLQAGLPPNPVVGFGEQQLGSRGREEQDNVAFSQEFVTAGKLRLNREVAVREVARAEQELAMQRARVRTDVRIAFYEAIIAQKQRGVADELVRIARQGVKSAEEADKDDPGYQNDILEARIELRTTEIDARKAINRHLAAWRTLAAIAGDPGMPLEELTGDVDTIPGDRDWCDVLQRVQTQSPQVAAAVTQIQRARAAWRRAVAEPTPNVTLDTLFNWRDNGINGDPDGAIQLSFPLPVWNRNQGAIQQADAGIGMAERNFDRLQLALQQRLADVYEQYTNARFQVLQYKESILPDAREALRLTYENYRSGKAIYDDLLTSQRTNAKVNFAYLDALRDFRTSEAEMEGFLLTHSLKE